MKDMRHLLVTGSHRSGTTFTGKVLEKSGGHEYILEPFNKHYGLRGVEHWYPYPAEGDGGYRRLVNDFMAGKVRFKEYSEKPVKNIIKKFFGGPLNKRWKRYRQNPVKPMLIKDPLAALLSEYFFATHNVDVLVLIRHPMAFYSSLKRVDWRFDFKDLLEQEELVETHLQDEKALMLKGNLDFAQEAALIWRCVNKILLEFSDRHANDPRWLLMRHEDICLDNRGTFKTICETFDIPFAPVDAYLQELAASSRDEHATERVHDFRRNPKQLAFAWKDRTTPDELARVKDIAYDLASRLYDDASWDPDAETC